MKTGLFITFEGSEGCGKSTQLALLATRLRERVNADDVLTLREPGGTPIGEEIRDLLKCVARGQAMQPETELLLFAASRAQLVREVISPALAAGRLVLCDRFLDSTTVYQGVARQLDAEAVAQINHFAAGERLPDATLLFDLPVAAARERLRLRAAANPGSSLAADRLEQEPDDFFEAVRAGYHRLAAAQPERWILIDATAPADEVERVVWNRLSERFHGFFS